MVDKVTKGCNIDTLKNNMVFGAEERQPTMDIYMKECVFKRDERQWKINKVTKYNLVLQHYSQGKEELKKWTCQDRQRGARLW